MNKPAYPTITTALLFASLRMTRLDADVLLAFVLAKPRSFLYGAPEYVLTKSEWQQYQACIKRRVAREPVAYIVGKKEFWSLSFQVNQHTLIPRPETELLVETILTQFDANHTCTLADVGTGCGAIAIAIAKERAHWNIFASDISTEALAIAKANAEIHDLHQISFYHGHLLNAFLPQQKFDVIVSNPPYLSLQEWQERFPDLHFEPKSAFVCQTPEDEGTGLSAIDELISMAKSHLHQNGMLILEHGFTQGEAVRKRLSFEGFQEVTTLQDFAHLDRISYGKLNNFVA